MSVTCRRVPAIAVALFLAGSLAASSAFAQTGTVGPAGGTSTTTSPGNAEGTPSGGTGVVGTKRVGPSNVSPSATPDTGAAEPATTRAHHRRRARHRRAHHPAPTTAAPSQDSTTPTPQ